MKTFQQPLSAEEEAFYIKEMREKQDSEEGRKAKHILIERNLRLVAHVAKKYQCSNESAEELISVGVIGLIKAVDSFDASKGNRFATYAVRCIDNELLMMFRAGRKCAREVSLYEPIGTDKEGNEISLLDVCEAQQTDVVEQLELQFQICKLTELFAALLNDRERQILSLRYGLGRDGEITQKAVGEVLGISRSYVSRIEKRALKKLREGFNHISCDVI